MRIVSAPYPASTHSTRRVRPAVGLFLNMPMQASAGRYFARYPHLFDFFLMLGERAGRVELCVPVLREAAAGSGLEEVELPANVGVVALPHWNTMQVLARRIWVIAPAAVWQAWRGARRWDAVGAVVPSVVGNVFIAAARLRGRPTFLLVRGEKQRTVRWMLGSSRWTGAAVRALATMERPVRRWIAAGVPTFVAGDELLLRYDVPGARVYNLYPGLSRDFPVAPAPRPASGAGPLRLVCVSRLSPEKGIEDLLAAMATLRGEGRAVELVLVGDGVDADDLRAQADRLELDGAVRFAGFVPHGPALVAALDAGDVFVLPSRSEGLPHSVVEAMARGLPVVATDVGGLPRLLSGGDGVLVPQQQPQELARALALLADDPAERERLSARSLAVAARFAPAAQLDELCGRLAEAYPGLDWSA